MLEHGAWADASSWNGVIPILQHEGYTVYAPPDPLRSLPGDSTYLADFLSTIPGPIVLVGHSYGGAVITNAATGNPNVKALVYIDAFIPKKGDTVFGLTSAMPGSCLNPAASFNFVPYPGGPAGDMDAYLKVGPNGTYPGFAQCFANGVPAQQAAELAVGQRPIALSAGSEKSGVPAWRTIPSWALIGTADHVIPPAELAAMANRAGSHITVRQRRPPVDDLPPGRRGQPNQPRRPSQQLTSRPSPPAVSTTLSRPCGDAPSQGATDQTPPHEPKSGA